MIQSTVQLEQLPSEIITIILHSIPDINSLLAFIASSPRVLGLYRQVRDQVFPSVVRNEIGLNLIRHAIFLIKDEESPCQLEDFTNGRIDMNLVDINVLRREERLTREIIQACVDDELKTAVKLTDTEWLRLRRGFYNLRVAARLGESTYMDEFQDISPFCRYCTPSEIMEILYILYCLRNRFTRHLRSLDETVLSLMIRGEFTTYFNEDLDFYTVIGMRRRIFWHRNGPFTSYIDELNQECQVPAYFNHQWSELDPDPCYGMEEVEPIEVLDSCIPVNHTFDDAEGEGFRWLRQSELIGISYNYHHAIPLGFMIWDDERLKEMDWMRKEPPREPVKQEWRSHCESYQSVEERFQAYKQQRPHETWKTMLEEARQECEQVIAAWNYP